VPVPFVVLAIVRTVAIMRVAAALSALSVALPSAVGFSLLEDSSGEDLDSDRLAIYRQCID